MLSNVTKKITMEGQCIVDGKAVEGYQAKINSDNPEDMTLSSWQNDKTACKEHRTQCRQDKAAFDDMAYELQDEMIAEKAAQMTEEA